VTVLLDSRQTARRASYDGPDPLALRPNSPASHRKNLRICMTIRYGGWRPSSGAHSGNAGSGSGGGWLGSIEREGQ